MASNTNAQSSLEEHIVYQAALEIEEGGNYLKGDAITRRNNAKQIVDILAMYAKNWVNVQRDP